MRYRDMVFPIMVSVLPGRGDAAADLVEPVGDESQMSAVGFSLARSRPLEHHKALPVGMEGEVPCDTSVCKLPLRP